MHHEKSPKGLQQPLLRSASGQPPPLADRMRPRQLEELLGQEELLSSKPILQRAIERDQLPSLIVWGPPGSGKTSLAHVIAQKTRARFIALSAVLSGVAELRKVVKEAQVAREESGQPTLVFVDEVHRFNKSQQDAFLPHLEDGTLTLLGATTENPSFSVNAAVLSRCKVFRLEALSTQALISIAKRALEDSERGLGKAVDALTPEALRAIAEAAHGDARRALNLLETTVLLSDTTDTIDVKHVRQALDENTLLYDKKGEEHYNVTSAFIKSLRGSDPDAAIYWMMRMLQAGDDPLFILRRLIIFASEDIGNADPRALTLTTAADAAFRRIGMPEGIYPLTQACLYLASCPKSNAALKAWKGAQKAIVQSGALPVPKKLRNAVTALMRDDGYGENYRYAHDYDDHVVPGESYLPDELVGTRFYEPSDQGLEQSIKDRLERLRRNAASKT